MDSRCTEPAADIKTTELELRSSCSEVLDKVFLLRQHRGKRREGGKRGVLANGTYI